MTIYKGKTTEDAIEKGLKDLALDKNKVKIEVKHQGNTGVFGLFASEAIVDIRPLTEKEILNKKYQKIFMIVGVTIAIFAFVCIGIFSSSKED
ncbi:Jag N-terminal domain-containing protein, partial [Streptococcus sanguinis]|uniref:Jag N-terminal domain-containing protein n=3 Tax=Streptococcus TaxID=1301 RepID=UPI001CC1B9AD